MQQSFKDSIINKSIIKFVDIILDLYSPVPYQIRNQMRILQSTLLYGHSQELVNYIDNLKEKLTLRERYRQNSLHCHSEASLLGSNKSQNKPIRKNQTSFHFNDADKENKFYLNNLKPNVSENFKHYQHSLNSTMNQNPKTRKISAIEYINKQEDCLYDNTINKKHSARQPTEIGRNSSRNILKIIKKSKSGRQKLSVTEKSIQCQPQTVRNYDGLKFNADQILGLMDKNSNQIIKTYGEYLKIHKVQVI